jgi:aryl-alcohol dehydrogenase-like predicted oxidoreductase
MPVVPLGASGLMVSRLALGSWRTYERISREQGLAVMVVPRGNGAGLGNAELATRPDGARLADRRSGGSPRPDRDAAAVQPVATVLFGATRPDQIRTNLAALDVAGDLSADERSRLTSIGA